ncbi:MAG TPA: DUF1707 and FHA domain-containing protein [Streptosporangiaceae bacterium]|jgi:hypothetical protein|nr:DUF1707 and FHA domain-containing protein [Streptosporangiaceae bacterium]
MAGPFGGAGFARAPLRASDADREEAVAQLREGFAAGQLSQDTFVYRMEAALGARDQGELAGLFTDLPAPRRLRMPAWRRLPARIDAGSRAKAVFTPVRGAVQALPSIVTSARRMGLAGRRPRLPGLSFPSFSSQLRFTIGRDPGCDLVIPDLTVSRRHAGLDRGLTGWLLTDFGSTNGTRLNGWRVREPVPVHSGDRVSFGDVTFVLLPDR